LNAFLVYIRQSIEMEQVTANKMDILLILDQSGSMLDYKKEVASIYKQVGDYCVKYGVPDTDITTIGFSGNL